MSVTAAHGFTAAGASAGLKSPGDDGTRPPDVALVVNTGPTRRAAAVFTTNTVAAAPVQWSRRVIADGRAEAVVLNSGGANACTGAPGLDDARITAEQTATRLGAAAAETAAARTAPGISADDVLICSTGLIGQRLDMPALLAGVEAAVTGLQTDDEAGAAAAQAIMTTDTVTKTAAGSGAGFTVGGMAKGAGMLAPGMATMLSVVTTDARIDQSDLDAALREAVRLSFDRADSDGCMSTNDTVVLMASGAHPDPGPIDLAEFQAQLTAVCRDLAAQLIADAEGAHHEIAIRTINAADEQDAETAGRAVARSALFKTAIFGRDPNWGRILSAVGTTQIGFDPDRVDVAVNGVWVCRDGGIGEDRSLVDLSPRRAEVIIDLRMGEAEATILTNDLTHDYVHENSAYSS